MTVSRPPRACNAAMRFLTSGTVQTLPFEASGLPPMMTMCCVRSISGMGNSALWPNISNWTSWCGIWSTVEAEKADRAPMAFFSAGTCGEML